VISYLQKAQSKKTTELPLARNNPWITAGCIKDKVIILLLRMKDTYIASARHMPSQQLNLSKSAGKAGQKKIEIPR
jgi:hypothetical protein